MAAGELTHEQIANLIGDNGVGFYSSEHESGQTYSIYKDDVLYGIIEVVWKAVIPGGVGITGNSMAVPELMQFTKITPDTNKGGFTVFGKKAGQWSGTIPQSQSIPKPLTDPNSGKSFVSQMTPEEYAKHRDGLMEMLKRNLI